MSAPKAFRTYRLIAERSLVLDADPVDASEPAPGAVQCMTLYSALSPGTELSAYRGDPPLRPVASPYPRLMGYCNVARVLRVGDGVPEHLCPGTLVLTHQSHRSGFCIPHEQVLAVLPDGTDPVAASVTYLFHLGYAAFLKSGATQGDSAAIVGLGTLGLTTSAVFRHGGIPVTAFSNYGIDDALQSAFGVTSVQSKSAARGVAGQQLFDHVILTSNHWDDWKLALELCAPSGVVTVLGFPGRGQGAPDFNPLDSSLFYDKQLRVQACGYTPVGLGQSRRDQPRALRYNCQFLVNAISENRLPGAALVRDVVPYTSLGDVYEEMLAGDRSAQTTVLDWSE